MLEVGMKLSDVQPRLTWLDFKLTDRDLAVGDLVTLTTASYDNGMTLYRISKDCPPNGDLVWSEVNVYHGYGGRSRKPVYGWVKKGTRTKVPDIRVSGCIEIVPVVQLFPGPPAGKKTIAYRRLYRLRKVDILELGRTFSKLQDFINQEAKRLST